MIMLKFAKIRNNDYYKQLIAERIVYYMPTYIPADILCKSIIGYVDWQLIFSHLDWPVAEGSIHLNQTVGILLISGLLNDVIQLSDTEKYTAIYSIFRDIQTWSQICGRK